MGWQQPDKTHDRVVAASSLKPGQKMLNLLLCTLNWETLGQPKAPPPCAQLGAPISKQQPGVIERLEALLTHCLRMPQFHGHELGRAAGTFQGFIDSLQQLPDTHSGSGDLSDGQLNCKSTCLIFRSPRSQTAQLRRKLARSVEALFSDYA